MGQLVVSRGAPRDPQEIETVAKGYKAIFELSVIARPLEPLCLWIFCTLQLWPFQFLAAAYIGAK
jgi:hypothetical protein